MRPLRGDHIHQAFAVYVHGERETGTNFLTELLTRNVVNPAREWSRVGFKHFMGPFVNDPHCP